MYKGFVNNTAVADSGANQPLNVWSFLGEYFRRLLRMSSASCTIHRFYKSHATRTKNIVVCANCEFSAELFRLAKDQSMLGPRL